MKTKAAVLVEINKPLVVKELDVPKLLSGQCLVRIQTAGICGTQLSEQQGLKGKDPYIPHLLGHEASGIVEAVGPDVKKISRGDYVVVSWIKGSGADVGGGRYTDENGAIVNSGGAAVFSEYAVVSENRVTPVPKSIPPKVAALLGCAIPTGVGVVLNSLDVKKNQSIIIFGVGGVGGAAILAAKIAGCREIIAVDIKEDKLKFAKELGATHVVLNEGDAVTSLVKSILPNGVDAGVEATGVPKVAELAFEVLGRNGRLAIAGHPAKGLRMSLDPFMFIEGRSVVGTWGGGVDPDTDIPRFAQMYLDGALLVDKLITHTYGLAEINEALDRVKTGAAGRVMITINGEG